MKNRLRLSLFIILSLLFASAVYGATACNQTEISKSGVVATATTGCNDGLICPDNMIDGDIGIGLMYPFVNDAWWGQNVCTDGTSCFIKFDFSSSHYISKILIKNIEVAGLAPPPFYSVYFGNDEVYNNQSLLSHTITISDSPKNVNSVKVIGNSHATKEWAVSEVYFYEYTNYKSEECDGVDNDCDALIDEDLSVLIDCSIGICHGDGYKECVSGEWQQHCVPIMNLAIKEECNGLDDDCDGVIDDNGAGTIKTGNVCDADNDGFFNKSWFSTNHYSTASPRVDCNDNDALINPDAKERFNGLDDDCDVEVDEGLLWKQKIITNTKGSKCVMKGNLNCTIGSGDNIMVFQEINHLLPGKYKFSFDNLSRNMPSVDIRTFNELTQGATNLCQNFGQKHYCEFEISESKSQINIRIKLGFTASAVVDNAMLQLVDPANDEVFKYDPRFNMSSIDIETFISIDRPASCCPIDYCWNGDKCIDSSVYMTNVNMPPLIMDANGNGYRCIKKKGSNESEWTYSEKKYTPFRLDSGYCSYPDMCLVTTTNSNPNYVGQTPHYGCAESGEFVANSKFNHTISKSFFDYDFDNHFKDFYCNAGNWTSRTKLLAMKLMEIGNSSGENFMLFCDRPGQLPKENQYDEFSSLNYYGYSTERLIDLGLPLQMFDNDINLFNNFCALIIDTSEDDVTGDVFDAEDTVIIGASMNKHFNDYIEGTEGDKVNDLFQEIFKGNCTGKITDKNYDFSKCTENLYYNNHTMAFIYSTDDLLTGYKYSSILQDKIGPLRSIIKFFAGIIDYFKNLLKTLFVENITSGKISVANNYLLEEDLYSRAYYSKIKSGNIYREIQGVAQKGKDQSPVDASVTLIDYAYIKYINYPHGMCNYSEVRDRFVLNVPFEDEDDKEFQSDVLRKYTNEYACDVNGSVTNIVLVGSNEEEKYSIDELWYDLTARTRLQR